MQKTFLFIICVLLIFSCKENRTNQKIVIALQGDPISLDPMKTTSTLTFQVTDSFYNTLLKEDENGKINLELAESYTVEDPKKVSFVLKKNVFFHDGSPLDSFDVKASLNRLLQKDSAYADSFASIKEVDVKDELHFSIILNKEDYSIISALSSNYAVIMPSEKIESGYDFSLHPVGTGPYVFKKRREGSYIESFSNANYFKKKIEKTKVVFQILSDESMTMQGLISGSVDIASLNSIENVNYVERSSKCNILQDLSNMVLVLSFNLKDNLLKDINLRRAIASAINKQEILNSFYGGGKTIDSFIDANSIYNSKYSPYKYDLEKAKEYLLKSNYDGSELEITVPQNYTPHVAAGIAYSDYLSKIGIKTSIKKVEWAYWISEVYGKGKFQMTVIGHSGKTDLQAHFSGFGDPSQSYVGWRNEKVYSDIISLRTDFDLQDRKLKIDSILKAFADELPFVYIGSPYRYLILNNRIHNVYFNYAVDSFNLENMHIE